jgi:hypothetical protein
MGYDEVNVAPSNVDPSGFCIARVQEIHNVPSLLVLPS